MRLFPKLSLSPSEKFTFRMHLFYSVINGIIQGTFILNEFVFIKGLDGENVLLAFLFQFSMVVFLFAALFNEILKRSRNKRKLILRWSLFARLPMVAFLFFPDLNQVSVMHHYIFLGVFLLYFVSKPVILPTINLFLKQQYRSEVFGRLFSYSTSVQKAVMLVFTFLFGFFLDVDPGLYRYVYPVMGLLGVLAVYLLTKIDYEEPEIEIKKAWYTAVSDSFSRMYHILKANKAYRFMELGFILYGFAWMSTAAVITIFYNDVLHLNYTSMAFYKNAFNLLAIAVLPFFGRLISHLDPRKFGLITFTSLGLYLFFTGLTEYFPVNFQIWEISIYSVLMIAVVFNGSFMGSMPLLWGIGSSYFCKPEEASDYQSIHLFLTGFRALLAPIIGIKIYEWYGFSVTFGVGIVFLFLANAVLIYSLRRHKIPAFKK